MADGKHMSAIVQAPKITDNDRLGLTLFLATVLHGIVILGVTFSISQSAKSDASPALDIILLQTQNPSKPDEAKYLAQVSQQGGGETEQQHRPRDIFTAPSLSQNPGVALQTATLQRSSRRQTEQIEILHQLKAEYSVDAVTDLKEPTDEILSNSENTNRNNQTARLAQELSDRIELEAEKPRTKYLNSSTREFVPAHYMREWIDRVERIGNLNYPDQARRNKLSGTLILDVVINADGKLVKTDLRRSSGHQLLDDAARRIVELAAPYPPFPSKLKDEADVIHITRSWEFMSTNQLRTN
jgi:periplasmic protein TonB